MSPEQFATLLAVLKDISRSHERIALSLAKIAAHLGQGEHTGLEGRGA